MKEDLIYGIGGFLISFIGLIGILHIHITTGYGLYNPPQAMFLTLPLVCCLFVLLISSMFVWKGVQ